MVAAPVLAVNRGTATVARAAGATRSFTHVEITVNIGIGLVPMSFLASVDLGMSLMS